MSWGRVSAHRAIKVLRSGYGVIVLLVWEAFPFSFSAFAQPAASDLLPYPIPSLSGTQAFVTHNQRLASEISAFVTKGLAVGSFSSSLGSILFFFPRASFSSPSCSKCGVWRVKARRRQMFMYLISIFVRLLSPSPFSLFEFLPLLNGIVEISLENAEDILFFQFLPAEGYILLACVRF